MGNFAILRVEKVKTMSGMAARGRHNFREQDTPNADSDRLGLNAIEGAKSTNELLKAVSDLLPQKRRKDAVIGLEYLITASPEHFGDDWQETKNFGMDYFSDAIEWLEKKHGKGNVICKTVHLDESTPHLAAFVVPLKDGKLNAKAFTGGAKVLAEMQTSFAVEVGEKHGLDRGIERSKAVHQDNAKIQPMTIERMQLRKQVKTLSDEVERLTKNVASGDEALTAAKAVADKYRKMLSNAAKIGMEDVQKIAELKKENEKIGKYAKELESKLAEANAVAAKALEERAQVLDFQGKFTARMEEKRQRELEAKLMASFQPEPAVDVNKLMEKWEAERPNERQKEHGTNGSIKAVEGPYVIQHIGMGKHVAIKLADGVKAPSVGSTATIKNGQVVDVKVQERGGLSK